MSRTEMLNARTRARELKKRLREGRAARQPSAAQDFAIRSRHAELGHRIVRLRWLGQQNEADALERGLRDAVA